MKKEYNQSVQQKHAYGTSKDLSCTKVEIECNNIINTEIINSENVTNENIKKYNPNWPQSLDHPYRKLMTGGSWSGKTKCIT